MYVVQKCCPLQTIEIVAAWQEAMLVALGRRIFALFAMPFFTDGMIPHVRPVAPLIRKSEEGCHYRNCKQAHSGRAKFDSRLNSSQRIRASNGAAIVAACYLLVEPAFAMRGREAGGDDNDLNASPLGP